MRSVAKLAVGQRVSVAFNGPTPDLRVPNQANGKAPGTGHFQTSPDMGEVLEVRETDGGTFYLVLVELVAYHDIGGKKRAVKSLRKRVIHESKLTAV